nr:MAG TPA: hypothetical protein [Caudoviricetes sp.]
MLSILCVVLNYKTTSRGYSSTGSSFLFFHKLLNTL